MTDRVVTRQQRVERLFSEAREALSGETGSLRVAGKLFRQAHSLFTSDEAYELAELHAHIASIWMEFGATRQQAGFEAAEQLNLAASLHTTHPKRLEWFLQAADLYYEVKDILGTRPHVRRSIDMDKRAFELAIDAAEISRINERIKIKILGTALRKVTNATGFAVIVRQALEHTEDPDEIRRLTITAEELEKLNPQAASKPD